MVDSLEACTTALLLEAEHYPTSSTSPLSFVEVLYRFQNILSRLRTMATLNGGGDASFLEEWVESTTFQKSDVVDIGPFKPEPPSVGFAWTLYEQTLKLFAILRPLVPGSKLVASRQHNRILKDGLGKLFLWGDGFRDGRLETVLEESDDLKASIVSGLVAIGSVLITRSFCHLDLNGVYH